mmetsp:Transcript_52924/g.121479  ORF Transcript_52924/g.121479 Transcript_52924/m.121479 type:complete len:226 (-) Transcript_52924:333-1010(-)
MSTLPRLEGAALFASHLTAALRFAPVWIVRAPAPRPSQTTSWCGRPGECQPSAIFCFFCDASLPLARRTQTSGFKPRPMTASTHAIALLQSKMSEPSCNWVRRDVSISTQSCPPAATASILMSSSAIFLGESPPAKPNGTLALGSGHAVAQTPKPMLSSYRNERFGGGCSSSFSHRCLVCELCCRMNSICGTAPIRPRREAAHLQAPSSSAKRLMSQPLAEVALI